jgi:hypothetical protein
MIAACPGRIFTIAGHVHIGEVLTMAACPGKLSLEVVACPGRWSPTVAACPGRNLTISGHVIVWPGNGV